MATTSVLLKEDVENLGGRGDVVTVKAGYARNFLLPKGIALLATKGNVKQIKEEQKFLLKKAAEERTTADAQREQMKGISLTFERLAGESGALFGSVTSMDIAEGLKEEGYDLDRRRIILRMPIKELGEFTVPVKLHREVTLELPITVKAEGEAIQERSDEVDEALKQEEAKNEENSDTEGSVEE